MRRNGICQRPVLGRIDLIQAASEDGDGLATAVDGALVRATVTAARQSADDAEAVAGEGGGQAVRDLERRRRGRARADDRDAWPLGQPSADPQPDGRVRDRRQQAGVSRLVQSQVGQAEPAARVERLSSQALQVAGGVDMVEPLQCGLEESIGGVGAGNCGGELVAGRREEREGDEVDALHGGTTPELRPPRRTL